MDSESLGAIYEQVFLQRHRLVFDPLTLRPRLAFVLLVPIDFFISSRAFVFLEVMAPVFYRLNRLLLILLYSVFKIF